MKKLILSNLAKTWFIDVDGIIFEHNSYLNGQDILVEGFMEFYKKIPANDFIIIMTSRDKKYQKLTIDNLKKSGIRFNEIIFNLPKGERILINDIKPENNLKSAIAINQKRDKFINLDIQYNPDK